MGREPTDGDHHDIPALHARMTSGGDSLDLAAFALLLWSGRRLRAADEPDLIFRRSTVFKLLSPNDKLATYGVDDPEVEGVACHFTVPEKGGYQGLARAGRAGLGHFAGLPPDRPDSFQGQDGAGRRHVPAAPLAVLQENADRARLRRQAERAGLHGLFGQADRRLAEKLDLVGADHAVGQRPMPRSRNAATSSSEAIPAKSPEIARFRNRLAAAGFGIAASNELKQFLRSRLIAAAAVAALLGHRAADLRLRPAAGFS